jgi:hypothetical protein
MKKAMSEHVAKCPGGRRDHAIVAWHEVPGTTPPQKRAVPSGTVCRYLAGSGVQEKVRYDEKYHWDYLRPIIPYPTGRFFGGALSQALRARLRSACPSGTVGVVSGLPILLVLGSRLGLRNVPIPSGPILPLTNSSIIMASVPKIFPQNCPFLPSLLLTLATSSELREPLPLGLQHLVHHASDLR